MQTQQIAEREPATHCARQIAAKRARLLHYAPVLAVPRLRRIPMIGMPGKDLLGAVELLEEHAARQQMRPGHRAQ